MAYQLTQQALPPTQIYLNSKFADMYGGDPSYRSWCYFVFHEPIVKVPSGYKYLISLNNAEIPNSMYNVNETNNKLQFGLTSFPINGEEHINILDTITIQPGNYSADDIATLLTNLQLHFDNMDEFENVTTETITLDTTYDGSLNKFKFTIKDVTLVGGLPSAHLVIVPTNNKPNPIFGFSGQNIIAPTPAITDSFSFSDRCIDVTGTRAAFFRLVNVHTAGFDSKSKISTNILARIPISCEPNNILYWQNITLFKTIAQTKNLNVIEIQITDSEGNLLNFNGVDWSASIEINVLGEDNEKYRPDGSSDGLRL